MSKIKLGAVYEDVAGLKVISCNTLRDGGSRHIEFNDGFECLYDWGMMSKTKGKFVKSWQDRTVIELDEKHLNVLKTSVKGFDTIKV